MKKIEEFLPHLSLCMLLCLEVFVVLDSYNRGKWLDSTAFKVYVPLCVAVGIATSITLIVRQRRRRRRPKQAPDQTQQQ